MFDLYAEDQDTLDLYKKDLRGMLLTKGGRRWFYHFIYGACPVERQVVVFGDPEASAFNEASRLLGIRLLEHIKTEFHPLFLRMLEENHDREDDGNTGGADEADGDASGGDTAD